MHLSAHIMNNSELVQGLYTLKFFLSEFKVKHLSEYCRHQGFVAMAWLQCINQNTISAVLMQLAGSTTERQQFQPNQWISCLDQLVPPRKDNTPTHKR